MNSHEHRSLLPPALGPDGDHLWITCRVTPSSRARSACELPYFCNDIIDDLVGIKLPLGYFLALCVIVITQKIRAWRSLANSMSPLQQIHQIYSGRSRQTETNTARIKPLVKSRLIASLQLASFLFVNSYVLAGFLWEVGQVTRPQGIEQDY